MKELRNIQKLFCALLFCLFIILSFQGCIGGPSGGASKAKANPPSNSKELSDIDKEIDSTKKLIEGYEEFRIKQLHRAVINESKHISSRGWVKLDDKPTYEEIATRSYANVAATEKEIKRLEKKIDDLGDKKQEAMNHSSGCFLPESLVEMDNGSLKPFKKLKPGQTVRTYDIGYEKPITKKISKIYSVKANHLYTINGQLMTTGSERVLSREGWKKIRDLKKGDFIHRSGRMVKIKTIDYMRVDQTLYNIQVADTHNFYVVTPDGSSYLVHNSSGGGGGSSGGGGASK